MSWIPIIFCDIFKILSLIKEEVYNLQKIMLSLPHYGISGSFYEVRWLTATMSVFIMEWLLK